MNLTHTSAKPSHYNKEAISYDAFNEQNSVIINKFLEKILKEYKTKTVLDLTCGTGSQVFWLAKRKFDIVGCDINTKMLNIAKEKATKEKLDVKFLKGDIRTTQAGKFDAVITIFNAIGHLTKDDFEKAIRNIYMIFTINKKVWTNRKSLKPHKLCKYIARKNLKIYCKEMASRFYDSVISMPAGFMSIKHNAF